MTFPANPAATAGARCISMTDEWLPYLRTPILRDAEGARAEDGAATSTEEPREHSEASLSRARQLRALRMKELTHVS